MYILSQDKKKNRQVVVITGASAGVGRATAQAFARRGARIGLLARGEEGLKGAQCDVERLGGEALVLQGDVANSEQVEAAADEVVQRFGPIDIWVNNAMTSVFSPFKEMSAEEFRRATDVTYLGYVYSTMSALKHMLPRDHGQIVQVGSALAYRGIPLQSAYCGAKHAIQGFTESVRTELIHDQSKVKISMVQMPALNTPQFGWVKSRLPRKSQPVPPIYQPEVAAEAIYRATRHYRPEWYLGLSTWVVITGNKIAPALGDLYLGRTGYESQQYDGEVELDRPNNLWTPVPGDHGARGEFGSRAHSFSIQHWVDARRSWLAAAGASIVAASSLAGSVLSRRKG